MPITTQWDNDEQTVIYQQYIGNWALNDLRTAIDTTYDLIQRTDHSATIDIIADMHQSRFPTREIFALVDYYNAKRHPQQGIYVLVGSNPFFSSLRILTGAARILIPQAATVEFAPTVDKARLYLQHRAGNP